MHYNKLKLDRQLERLRDAFHNEVGKVAMDLYWNHVVPFCDAQHACFNGDGSGWTIVWIRKRKSVRWNDKEATVRRMKLPLETFRMLNTPGHVIPHETMAYHMPDYMPRNIT